MMRDKIAAELWRVEAVDAGVPESVAKGRTPEAFADQSPELRVRWFKFADAILAALPGMIPDLVWKAVEEDRGDGHSDETGEFESGPYYLEIGFGSDSYVWSVVYLSDDVSHGHDCPEGARAAANAHHRAAIAKAAGWTP